MSTQFKPSLFPNDTIEPEEISYPMIGSYKLDGIRCIFKDGLMLSRSLKLIPNKQLQEKFKFMRKLSKSTGLIYDGELYSEELTFQKITHFVMTKDLTDEKTKKKLQRELKNGKKTGKLKDWLDLPFHLHFKMFDVFNRKKPNQPYSERLPRLNIHPAVYSVAVKMIFNADQATKYYKEALVWGHEGIMLRHSDSLYKFGRYTIKSGDGYKFKPYETFDARIIDVFQATRVDPNAERKTNELGRSVTSKKIGDRIPIPMAAGFIVNYKEHQVKVVLAMNETEKRDVWNNRKSYRGLWIEYKGMLVGSKDVPRHPVFIRFRTDKDET